MEFTAHCGQCDVLYQYKINSTILADSSREIQDAEKDLKEIETKYSFLEDQNVFEGNVGSCTMGKTEYIQAVQDHIDIFTNHSRRFWYRLYDIDSNQVGTNRFEVFILTNIQ